MGLSDFFKNKKSPDMNKTAEEQISEIAKCYHSFFAEMSDPLKECSDIEARAIRIGAEIPIIAHYDFENFNTLLFNNMRLEIKEKASTFLQEQATFYVLFSDRYLFSKLGNGEGRNSIMEALESGYLNKMMNLANHNEAVWHHSKKLILEREKETSQCKSIAHLSSFYQSKLIHRLGLEKNYGFVRILLEQIIHVGTIMFAMNMLSTLEEE